MVKIHEFLPPANSTSLHFKHTLLFCFYSYISVSHVDGQATNSINIRAHTLAHLNKQLQFVVYENSVFISKPQTDFVRISWSGYSVRVPIGIKPKTPPSFIINHHVKPDFAKLVTFVTKTYLRSTCVKNLAEGIRKYSAFRNFGPAPKFGHF